MSTESGADFPQGLKPSRLWLGSARLKPRPFKAEAASFKEGLIDRARVRAKGYENEM